MTFDIQHLKLTAQAATPGKWDMERDGLFFYEDGYTKHLMETFDGSDIPDEEQHASNLRFIAAANPAAVLELIAEIERLESRNASQMRVNGSQRKRRKEWVERAGKAEDEAIDAEEERDQLKAENEALRAALTYIRDSGDDWHICEKAADALVDSHKDASHD